MSLQSDSFLHISVPPRPGSALAWPGKRLDVHVSVPSAHLWEVYDADTKAPLAPAGQKFTLDQRGLLLHGDNLDTLAWLLTHGMREQVRLIYIDPPYASGRAYASRTYLRGEKPVDLGDRVQYDDLWEEETYLQFMAERLLLLKELLTVDGTIWLHCDYRSQSRLHLLLEEIFGGDCYLNTIAWRSQTTRGAKVNARYFPRSTHYIHIFARSADAQPVWHPPRREIVMTRAEAAARYMEDERGFFRTSHPGSYTFERLVELHAAGRLYAPYGGEIVVDYRAKRVYASNGGNIGVKYYVEQRGRNRFVVTRAVDNLWDDIPGLGTIPSENVHYPTQKTEGLLRRIIETATNPDDLILDAFAGSGTSLAVAHQLGRRWVGGDVNWRAVRTTALRLARLDASYQLFGVGATGHPKWSETNTAHATMRLGREGGVCRLMIDDFYSPGVKEAAQARGVTLPADWRAQVQAILIDPAYDGRVLQPAVIDAPSGKQTLVQAIQPVPEDRLLMECPIGVLFVDVLGEEHFFLVSPN